MQYIIKHKPSTDKVYPWLVLDTDEVVVGKFLTEGDAKRYVGAPDDEAMELLRTMTGLVRLKYGNSDPDIWKAIQRAEAIVFERFLEAQGTREKAGE